MNELVKSITALNDVSYQSINELLDISSFKSYSKKEVLCQRNETPEKVYFIKSGIIRVFSTNENGTEFNKSLFFTNHFAGSFSALIRKMPSEVTVECLTDCEVIEANYAEADKIISDNLELATFSRRLLEKMFISFEKRQTELATQTATERYLNFLKRYEKVEHKIPQYHIASYLGITPIQLSRLKKDLG